MTREVAIKAIQDFIGWFKEDSLIRKALEMAIQALSQECVGPTQKHVGNTLDMRCDDAEQIDYHDDFETASRKIHDYEERQKQNDKKCCSDCQLIGTYSCYMVCGGSKSLYKPKQKQEPQCTEHPCLGTLCRYYKQPCDDVISRILKRMWNYRGKHTTSIDKVAMEQIIRDELPPVTQKPEKWIPVSERLPEEEIDVLVCNSNGEIELSSGSYSTVANDFMWYTSGWRFGKVTAWMPLPKPYEPQESEE